MMQSWELTDAQRQAAAQRQVVAVWERTLAGLDQQYELAAGAERAFSERRQQLLDRMTEIRGARRAIRTVDGYPTTAAPDAVIAEYRALERELGTVEAERQRWLNDRLVRWYDGPIERSYSLSTAGVDGQRGRVRAALGAASARLGELEARLSAGELVQTGVAAPEYVEQRARIEALRARLG